MCFVVFIEEVASALGSFISASEMFAACSKAFRAEMKGVVTLVKNLAEGSGPAPTDAVSFLRFTRRC